jgi:glutamate racemase
MNEKGSIGVFDSGLGGLWILKHLKDELLLLNK